MLRALGTLRWRLTLTFVGLLALLLAALGTYQYLALQRDLVDVRVGVMTGDISEVRAQVQRLLPRADRTPAGVAAIFASACTRLNGSPAAPAGAGDAAQRTIAAAVVAATGRTGNVVLYDRVLQPVVSVPDSLASVPHVSDTALRRALDTATRSDPEVLNSGTGNQLAVAYPITATNPRRPCGVLQLATSTQPIDDILASERTRLAIGGGSVVILALLIGLFLTSRALKPLRRVSDTAQQLAGGDLRARSNIPPRGDEVGTLAKSFDDMAARIESAFAAQAESESRMRRFIADASHELRTPITALKGYIDVMRRGAARDPQALEAALETMGREADRMRGLVLDLLTLARLDAQRPMEIGPLNLGEVVGAVLDEAPHEAQGSVRRQLDGAPVLVRADRNAVATIAQNLMGNAFKYAPGATQTWTTAVEDGNGVLRVHDDGPGIPAADVPHLFERFYRGEKTRAREEGGSGLGLSIVHGLVTALGGDVSVRSAEGFGTTFVVRLPLA
ncbi:MAG TPA: HAMP domain-containing sensor histidine kinase [Candidatus Dormibacteraeota bacterium]|jgi:two-component system OmpR family sensor kinase|nr:HAMP domain-containing sensor histidine kinase [Candidatus Dormibacteraeota bacterium]